MQMGKKRFRPRSHGGRGTGTGYGGGGYYQGSNGQGQNGRMRRRRHYQDRQDRPPPFGGEAAPAGPPPLGEDGLPLPEGSYPLAPQATEIPLEPGRSLRLEIER